MDLNQKLGEMIEEIRRDVREELLRELSKPSLFPVETRLAAKSIGFPSNPGGPRSGSALRAALDASGAKRRVKGEKRTPAALEALTHKLNTYIIKNPGQRIEAIGKALGVATKELALPARKLIAEKAVKTKGQKRATTYWAR